MKRVMTGVVAAALLVPALTACGGSNDFCNAAPEDIDTNDPAAMQAAFEEIRDDAPDEIRDDVDVIIEQLGLIEEDPASIDITAMTDAADALVEWEEENCN